MKIIPDGDSEQSKIDVPTHINYSLHTIVKSLGIMNTEGLLAILSQWESVVGKEASLISRVCSLRGQELIVEVDSVAWLENLQSRSMEIDEKILNYTGVKCSTRFVHSRSGD